jgi:hypothetical protein
MRTHLPPRAVDIENPHRAVIRSRGEYRRKNGVPRDTKRLVGVPHERMKQNWRVWSRNIVHSNDGVLTRSSQKLATTLVINVRAEIAPKARPRVFQLDAEGLPSVGRENPAVPALSRTRQNLRL